MVSACRRTTVDWLLKPSNLLAMFILTAIAASINSDVAKLLKELPAVGPVAYLPGLRWCWLTLSELVIWLNTKTCTPFPT